MLLPPQSGKREIRNLSGAGYRALLPPHRRGQFGLGEIVEALSDPGRARTFAKRISEVIKEATVDERVSRVENLGVVFQEFGHTRMDLIIGGHLLVHPPPRASTSTKNKIACDGLFLNGLRVALVGTGN